MADPGNTRLWHEGICGNSSAEPKTGIEPYSVQFFVIFLREMGWRRYISKSDGEPVVCLEERGARRDAGLRKSRLPAHATVSAYKLPTPSYAKPIRNQQKPINPSSQHLPASIHGREYPWAANALTPRPRSLRQIWKQVHDHTTPARTNSQTKKQHHRVSMKTFFSDLLGLVFHMILRKTGYIQLEEGQLH
jgi:hypothetical protein